MMKAIFIILFVLLSFAGFSQTPSISGSNGSPKTAFLTQGVPATDSGYWYRFSFADTGAANKWLIKNCAGAVIRVGDTLWMRSSDITHWMKQGGGGGGGGFVTANNAITPTSTLLQWGGPLIQNTIVGGSGGQYKVKFNELRDAFNDSAFILQGNGGSAAFFMPSPPNRNAFGPNTANNKGSITVDAQNYSELGFVFKLADFGTISGDIYNLYEQGVNPIGSTQGYSAAGAALTVAAINSFNAVDIIPYAGFKGNTIADSAVGIFYNGAGLNIASNGNAGYVKFKNSFTGTPYATFAAGTNYLGLGSVTSPSFRLHVDDPVKLSGVVTDRSEEFGGPDIHTVNEYLTITPGAGVNLQTRNLLQVQAASNNNPVEIRLMGGNGGAMANGVGVINGFNYDGPEASKQQNLFIITSGFNAQSTHKGGNIELIPGTNYVNATRSYAFPQFTGDSVIVKLNTDTLFRPYFYVRGREHLTDSLKLDNIGYYTSNLHGKFAGHTLVDFDYVDSLVAASTINIYNSDGTVSENRRVDVNSHTLTFANSTTTTIEGGNVDEDIGPQAVLTVGVTGQPDLTLIQATHAGAFTNALEIGANITAWQTYDNTGIDSVSAMLSTPAHMQMYAYRNALSTPLFQAYIDIYSDSVILWMGDRSSWLGISEGAADQYATNRLSWRTQDSTAKIVLTHGFVEVYGDDSIRFESDAGVYRFTDMISTVDSTTYKPVVMDVNGKIKRGTSWGNFSGGGSSGANTALSNLSAVAINATLIPGSSGAIDLGSTSKQWGSTFLKEGGVINWDNGDATLTQTSDTITWAGITNYRLPFIEMKISGTDAQFYNNVARTGMSTGIAFLTEASAGSGTVGGMIKFRTGSLGMNIEDAGGGAATRLNIVYGGNNAYLEDGNNLDIYPSASQETRIGANGTKNYLTINTSGFVGINTTSPTTALHTTSFATAYTAKTGTYGVGAADHTIETTSGTFTVTLPTAVGITGREYFITNTGSGVITLATTSSQTFVNQSGTPTTITINQFGGVTVKSNGSAWLVQSKF